MRVAVLRGGRSSEHEVSLRSGASVAEGLREAGHDVVDVVVERDGRWVCEGEEVEFRPGGGLLDCDAAFPVMHGPYGEDGTVQGALEVLGVPYAGPGVLAAATTIDKLTFKRLLSVRGIPQVDFCQAAVPGTAGDPDWRKRVASFGLPVWVKPSRLGSSVGISKVTDLDELDVAVREAARHDPRVIVEAHCDGLEVECSVLGNSEPQASVPGEIDAHADWYDYEAKYEAGGMDLVVPARIGEALAERVRELALEVFAACDCTGLARCDFFVAGDEVLVNELNTLPGFTETSVYSRLFEASGIPYPQLCDRLVRLGIERAEAQAGFEF